MAHEDASGQDTPDELMQQLLKLAKESSLEELQRVEAVIRIAKESRDADMVAKQAQIDLAESRLAESNKQVTAGMTALSEGLKLHFEAYKNLTVLDSGALVAFAVVTHYLVPSPVQQGWLSAAYSFVLVSLTASLVMTFIVGDRVYETMSPLTSSDRGRVWRIVIRLVDGLALGTFVVGLGLFLQFLNVNL